MIYLLLLYMHLCHYTGGETSSYISCHLFAYRLHVLLKINGVVYTLGEMAKNAIINSFPLSVILQPLTLSAFNKAS